MKLEAREVLSSSGIEASEFLCRYLDRALTEPLREFLNRPSKGVRSQLVQAGYAIHKYETSPKEKENLIQMAEIIEVLHAGTLIVDDIQDESLERRGSPSLHRIFGLAKALNAGNWLYFWAFKSLRRMPLDKNQQERLIELFEDTLFAGHIGQALDLGAPVDQLPIERLDEVCANTMSLKTGTLSGMAFAAGAILAGATADQTQKIFSVGKEFGVILQIYDDLKNVRISEQRKQDLKRFEDLRSLRPSFVWALAARLGPDAVDKLKECAKLLPDTDALRVWQERHQFVGKALAFVEERKTELNSKLGSLQIERPDHAQSVIKDLVRQLEEAYVSS